MPTNPPVLVGSYDYRLVTASVLIAMVASYAALDLAGRVTAARGRFRFLWLVGGAIAMGLGIWSMHYVGMLAYTLPVTVAYDWPTVLVSLLAAIFASGVALFIASRDVMLPLRTCIGGIVMGIGIAAMHYIGMEAMRLPAMCHYSPGLVTVSVFLAILISVVALWFTFHLRVETAVSGWRKLGAAILMGAAIPTMHYTGMAAATFTRMDAVPELTHSVAVSGLVIFGVIVVSLLLLGMAILTSLADRRFSGTALANENLTSAFQLEKTFNQTIIEGLPGLFYVIDEHAKIMRWNRNVETVSGYSASELSRISVLDLFQEPDRSRVAGAMQQVFSSGEAIVEASFCIKDQTQVPYLFSGKRSLFGDKLCIVGFGVDNSARKQAENLLLDSESKHRALFEESADANLLMGETGLVDCNSAALQMFGNSTKAEFIGLHPAEISPPNQPDGTSSREESERHIATAFLKGKDRFEWMLRRKNGEVFPAEVCLTAMTLSGRPALLGTMRDITEQKQAEAELARLARYDTLTGLANRAVFVESLDREIARARRGEPFAVLYLDLDHFKDVNDTLGHPIGDLLLQAVAKRLQESVRKCDLTARFGGDEFAIILANIRDPLNAVGVVERILDAVDIEQCAVAAAAATSKIMVALSEPFSIQGDEIRSGASIGIAMYGPDSLDAESILAHADLALYRAKSQERGTYCFFNEAMNVEVRARVQLNTELREAIVGDQLFLMYQPQVDIETGRIVGLEALVRWQHPSGGTLGPGKFIPSAEMSGLIVPLGTWVMRTACHQIGQWLDAGIALPTIAINLSGVQFKSSSPLEDDITASLAEFGVPARLLELELTESVLMKASREHNDLLVRLRETGHRIAIDDFGSGYSSLDYLRRYPVDRIKIAQSFTAGIGSTLGSDVIVRAALNLARELGIEVVVEGVETAAQLELLKAWGCLTVQGYYFARPLQVADVTPMLRIGKIIPANIDIIETPARSVS
ncbi:MAG: bifunctional diguanylate cyclase/phosphodiesterase [Acidobacteriaceae bacterium]